MALGMPAYQWRKLFNQGWKAGEEAAHRKRPLTQCPFGACAGRADEGHADPLICGWVNGYLEYVVQRDIGMWRVSACDYYDVHGVAIPCPDNPRVKEALVEGWTEMVVQMDIVQCETLQ